MGEFVVRQIQNFELHAPLQSCYVLNLVAGKVERLKVGALGNRSDTYDVALVEIEQKDGFEVEFLCLSLHV